MKMVVIGASAGGLQPIKIILEDLPATFNAAVLIIRHSTPGGPSLLRPILAEHSELPVLEVKQGMRITSGTVYVAPPGISVVVTTSENHELVFSLIANDGYALKPRPSIDLALVSAAEHFKRDCIGVVLSGYLNDGTQGAIRIDQVDGTMIAQHPLDAEHDSMPLNVIIGDSPDFVLPEVQIGELLRKLVERGSQAEERTAQHTET